MSAIGSEAAGGVRSDRLGFVVAGEGFSLPLAGIAEVLRPRALARPPHAPPSLLGILNLRGAVLPVVSAARLLGYQEAETTASRILVLHRDAPCGLLVDRLTAAAPDRTFDAEALLTATFAHRTPARRTETAAPRPAGAAPIAEAASLLLLGFTVAGQDYALPLDEVEAVLAGAGRLARIADSDPVIAGLIEYRGGVLPVVVLADLLGLPCRASAGPLLVARLAGGPVGLVVDALQGITRLPAGRLDAVPAVLTRGSGETRVDRIARSDDGTLVALLRVAKLFDEATQRRLSMLTEAAAPPAPPEERRERFVAVKIGRECFGVPAAAVAEVARRPERLAAVPRMPGFVLGVSTSRGRPLPVLDGGERLGAPAPTRRDGKLVVVALHGVQTALTVDDVLGMIEVRDDEIAAAPSFRRRSDAEGRGIVARVANHGGRCVFLIDPDALLDEAESDVLAAIEPAVRQAMGPSDSKVTSRA